MSMIEKAARAAHEALSRANVMAYLDMPDDTASVVARAVIEALMEPTPEMVEAVVPLPMHLIEKRNDPEYTVAMEAAAMADRAALRQKWQDLLTAALKEGEGA